MFWLALLALLVLFIISIFGGIFIVILTMKTKPRSKYSSKSMGLFVQPDGHLVNPITDEIESSVVYYDGWEDTILQPSEDDSVNRNHDDDGFVDNDARVSDSGVIEEGAHER